MIAGKKGLKGMRRGDNTDRSVLSGEKPSFEACMTFVAWSMKRDRIRHGSACERDEKRKWVRRDWGVVRKQIGDVTRRHWELSSFEFGKPTTRARKTKEEVDALGGIAARWREKGDHCSGNAVGLARERERIKAGRVRRIDA